MLGHIAMKRKNLKKIKSRHGGEDKDLNLSGFGVGMYLLPSTFNLNISDFVWR